jgi:hypothetical protein
MGLFLLAAAAAASSAATSTGSWRFSDEDPSTTYNFLAIGDWCVWSWSNAALTACTYDRFMCEQG